jgi:hypothetical protein
MQYIKYVIKNMQFLTYNQEQNELFSVSVRKLTTQTPDPTDQPPVSVQ